jgi:hypothetical protein
MCSTVGDGLRYYDKTADWARNKSGAELRRAGPALPSPVSSDGEDMRQGVRRNPPARTRNASALLPLELS